MKNPYTINSDLILKNVRDAIVIFNNRGEIIYWNQGAKNLYGYSEDEILGKPSQILTFDIDQSEIQANREKVLAGELERRIWKGKTKQGEVIWIDAISHPFIQAGEILGIIMIGKDVTERMLAMEELRETQNRLERTLAALHEAVFYVDPAGRTVIYCNEAVKKMFGYSADEIIGTSTELLHVNRRAFELFAEISEPMLGELGFAQFDYQMKRKNGEIFQTQHMVVALKDDKGWTDGVVSVIRDISEQHQAYLDTLEGWAKALDLKDHETEGHSRRVVENAVLLANHLNLDASEIENVRRGALLHDIGKIGVPDHILLKEGILTDEEWEIMKLHPVYAYNMIKPIKYLKDAIDIPYYHHEKWDGSGYPKGLKGNEIPLQARIFTIVDVFDALISKRPYRDAWPVVRVVEYLKEQKGKQFDPQIVDKFLSIIDQVKMP